jgi:CRP/FNR family cyclic AMP-dependent transcriptional regulator
MVQRQQADMHDRITRAGPAFQPLVRVPGSRPAANGRFVSVLAVDPALARDLDPDQAALARSRSLARVLTIEPGPWEPPDSHGSSGALGLLIIDGLLSREVVVADRPSLEPVARGDLLRPWDHSDGSYAPFPSSAHWTAHARTRMAVLDARLATAICPWPQLTAELLSRTLLRTRWLALLHAISHVTGLERRLLVLFWHLADRWGRVEKGGTVLPLPLTHEMLGKLAGARRQTVTTALGRLARGGLIVRRPDGWELRGDPIDEFERLTDNGRAAPVSSSPRRR